MAVLQIPLSNANPAFSFLVDLDGNSYKFVFRWNGRVERWVFDCYDNEGDAIQLGNPLQIGIPLLYQNRNSNKWPGTLICVSGSGDRPDRFNIGNDVRLFYEESL